MKETLFNVQIPGLLGRTYTTKLTATLLKSHKNFAQKRSYMKGISIISNSVASRQLLDNSLSIPLILVDQQYVYVIKLKKQ